MQPWFGLYSNRFIQCLCCRLGSQIKEDDLLRYAGDASTTGEESSFQSCCVELARRVWVVVVLGGKGQASFFGDAVRQDKIHKLVKNVIDTAMLGNGGARLDEVLYALAVGLGMPPVGEQLMHHIGRVRIMSVHHIVSVIQCGVMVMPSLEKDVVGVEGEVEEDGDLKKISDALRGLSRAFGKDDVRSAALDICIDVYSQIESIKSQLPAGFFDVMVPRVDSASWNDGQMSMLQRVSDQLKSETLLRRKMMVDRALATLQSFSSSQVIHGDPALMGMLDSFTEEARQTMDMICRGQVAGIDDAFHMTKGEIVSLLMESKAEDEKRTAKVKTVRIGHVPDRGGRPEGQSRAASLMPTWQKRKEDSAKAAGGAQKKPHNVGKNYSKKKRSA